MKLGIFAAAAAFAFAPFAAQAVTYVPNAGTPMVLSGADAAFETAPAGGNTLVPNAVYSGALQEGTVIAPGYAYFKFTAASAPIKAIETTIDLPLSSFDNSLEVAWLNAAGLAELTGSVAGPISSVVSAANLIGSDIGPGANGDGILQQSEFMGGGSSNELVSLFASLNEMQWLAVSWTSLDLGDQALLRVESIPVPAGFLLLGTAFVAAGVARRVNRKAA